MLRRRMYGLALLLLATSWASAINPPLIQLKTQLKLLRDQERGLVATIKARYQALAQQQLTTEEEFARERTIAKAEERSLLALAPTKADREKIHKSYQALSERLRPGAAPPDKAGLKELKGEERILEQQVKVIYGGRKLQLEYQIQTLKQFSNGYHRPRTRLPPSE